MTPPNDPVSAREIISTRLLPAPRELVFQAFREPEGNQTRITWRMLHPTVEKCERVKPFVIGANEQNLDKLAAELQRMAASN